MKITVTEPNGKTTVFEGSADELREFHKFPGVTVPSVWPQIVPNLLPTPSYPFPITISSTLGDDLK